MQNLLDKSARYLATILISALSLAADADDFNDKAKRYSSKVGSGAQTVHDHRDPAREGMGSIKTKP